MDEINTTRRSNNVLCSLFCKWKNWQKAKFSFWIPSTLVFFQKSLTLPVLTVVNGKLHRQAAELPASATFGKTWLYTPVWVGECPVPQPTDALPKPWLQVELGWIAARRANHYTIQASLTNWYLIKISQGWRVEMFHTKGVIVFRYIDKNGVWGHRQKRSQTPDWIFH